MVDSVQIVLLSVACDVGTDAVSQELLTFLHALRDVESGNPQLVPFSSSHAVETAAAGRSRDPWATTPLRWGSVVSARPRWAVPWFSRRPQPTPTTGLTATPHAPSWPVARVWGLVPSRLACQIVPSVLAQ
jgi:hypothetical protein